MNTSLSLLINIFSYSYIPCHIGIQMKTKLDMIGLR